VVPLVNNSWRNGMLVREKAKNRKWDAIEHLDRYLEEFERKITARGAKVIWAENAEEALEEIGKICEQKTAKHW
jgi:L-lactate dehydrogenase complex protein LldF